MTSRDTTSRPLASRLIDRRNFVLAAPFVLAACTSREARVPLAIDPALAHYTAMYGPLDDEPFPVPAVDISQIDPQFLRREVAYETHQPAGTIVVAPESRFAWLVLGNGRAIRYGVGVGREEAFNFQGDATIARKAQWPRWTPTPNMIRREPERYGPYAGGLEGGLANPLGARALYLYRDGRDTLYRLHGTNEPLTIGTMVSSGCVRFINQDIVDLYRRVPTGSRVVVLTGATPSV